MISKTAIIAVVSTLCMVLIFGRAFAKEAPEEILRFMPQKIGQFVAERSVIAYEDKTMGASLGYNSSVTFGTVLTVYLYDLGQGNIKDGIDSKIIVQAKKEAVEEVKSVEKEYRMSRNLKLLSDSQVDFVIEKGKSLKMLVTSFSFEATNPLDGSSLGKRVSYMYVTGARGYICKIRATTSSSDEAKEIQEAAKMIFSKILGKKVSVGSR